METINAYVSETVKLCVEITNSGVGITGETPTVTIKRMSDNKYWTGTIWQAGVATPTMSEYDNTNFPGLYTYDLSLIDTEEIYLACFTNTGSYAFNEFNKIFGRLKPLNETVTTRSSTSPASATYGEKMEEIYGAVVGRSQFANDGTGSRIKHSVYNYAETDVIKEMDILKPAGTVNSQTFDTNAMAGKKTST